MKLRSIAFAATVLLAASAVASDRPPANSPTLSKVVERLESRFHGDIVSVRYDDATGVVPHYHVDVRYTGHLLLGFDVDAETLDVVATPDVARDAPPAALADIAALAAVRMDGKVTSVALDAGRQGAPRYDVDVRVADGRIARLTVDPATREIGWRTPPVQIR